MDPVSALANIIAIIQAADRVIGLCKKFLQAVRDAPGDIRLILIEVSTIKAILENVQYLASETHGTNALAALAGSHGLIEGCRKAILELQGLLPPEAVLNGGSKVKALIGAIAWTWKDSKAKVLLAELSEYKSTINVAVTTNSAYVLLPGVSLQCVNILGVFSSFDVKELKASTRQIFVSLTGMSSASSHIRFPQSS
jgi:hypothetical protein